MARTQFLNRPDYWIEIAQRVPNARSVIAAIAYLGKGGAEMLPLRPGDKLVVDLSLGAVRQGVTNPWEIKKLIDNGVEVFTRTSLHAKVIVIDDVVIASSANVSANARDYLDEAGMLSTSPSAVRAAKRFILSKCSEPIFERYLKKCMDAYRPPQFKAAKTVRPFKQRKRKARLWYVGGLIHDDGKTDQDEIKLIEDEAHDDLIDPDHCEVDWIRTFDQPKWFVDIKENNWVIDCSRATRSSRNRGIGSPGRVMRKRKYKTKTGQTRYMLTLERPIDREDMSLTEFHKRWRQVAQRGYLPPQRTQAIAEILTDEVLRFWTLRGRKARR